MKIRENADYRSATDKRPEQIKASAHLHCAVTSAEDGVPQTIISLQHQDIPVSIINFSDQAYLDQDFTSDLGKLQEGLAHLSLSGRTALYDTVVTASDKRERTTKHPRKVLIIITDGEDNSSRLTLDNAIRRVRDMQGPIIYSIGLLFSGDSGGGDKRRARHALEALASQTGGIAFFPRSLQDVDALAAEAARDLRNPYVLAYHFARAPTPGYHAVKVRVRASGRDKLTVHARTGYYSKQSHGIPRDIVCFFLECVSERVTFAFQSRRSDGAPKTWIGREVD